MKNVIFKLLNTGVRNTLSDFEIKRTRLVNGFSIIVFICLSFAGIMVIVSLPVSLPEDLSSFITLIFATGQEKEILSEKWTIIFPFFDFLMALFGLIALIFNYFKKYRIATFIINFIALLFAITYTFFIGHRVSYFFLLTSLLPIMLYNKAWKYMAFWAMNVLSFILVVLFIGRYGEVFTTPDDKLTFSILVNMLPSFIILFSGILHFKKENLRTEADLNQKNKLLAKQTQKIISQRDELVEKNKEKDRANAALKKSKLKLNQSNKTKDKLFTIIAHDLRSPFSSILGISELIAVNQHDFSEAEKTEYFWQIHTSAKDTLLLLDNLLDWARSQTDHSLIEFRKILFSSVIQEVFTVLKSSASKKNIELNYREIHEIQMSTDQNILKTILRNLISNAIKFTQPNGKIDVFATSKSDHIEISVSDNGIGLPPEKCEILFNAVTNISSRGTNNEKGSGLGLMICKEFIDKLGGEIWVDSSEGKGSTFTFTIPN